jgi:hypothetical protein
MTTIFGDAAKLAPPRLPGRIPHVRNIMILDGIAINEVCHYGANRNRILEVCREHSHKVNSQVADYDTICIVEKAIHENKTTCYAKDVTIVMRRYTPLPTIKSLSPKQETAVQLVKWFRSSHM